MEYSLEVSTSTSRYLLERHSGTDARGKRFPWKRIAQFDSYNDAERVLELIQRGQDNAVHFEGDVVEQAVTTDDIYAVFPFDLTEYPKALAEVQRLLLTIAELRAEVERLATEKDLVPDDLISLPPAATEAGG